MMDIKHIQTSLCLQIWVKMFGQRHPRCYIIFFHFIGGETNNSHLQSRWITALQATGNLWIADCGVSHTFNVCFLNEVEKIYVLLATNVGLNKFFVSIVYVRNGEINDFKHNLAPNDLIKLLKPNFGWMFLILYVDILIRISTHCSCDISD